MRSPFPGMDPYFEACGLWEGFHNRLIHKIDESLARVLPRGYTIDTVVRSYVVLMELFADEIEETFVEIYAEGEERVLVTCIEVLSPSNKRRGSVGRNEYLRKRPAMLLGWANFIEIDLLRSGDKMPMLDKWPDCPYALLVCRQKNAPNCHVWPAHFRHRLPLIPIPLADPDPDLTLDLQPLIDDIYAFWRYDERLDYNRPLPPPLSEADAAWVRERLKDRTS